ncbi:MAG: FCD domain-containing protein [Pararhodobacter sp.]|nr:FCD domain-containing protein [Pararhodobacter sp.]
MTLAEKVYVLLRRDIVSGALPGGQPLRLEPLRQRYGAGFSPLREALNRLQAERLVVQAPLRGFSVAPISRAEMWDAIETRITIEVEALRRAIARGDDGWEARIVGAFHALSRQSARMGPRDQPGGEIHQALEARHRAFHRALIDACGSPRLLDYAERLHAETERYRLPVLAGDGAGAARDVPGEHRALMEAALARGANQAAALLAAHYRRTGAALEAQFADSPAPAKPETA